MRFTELDQPTVGDILEIEIGDQIVEAVVAEINGDEIISETDNIDGGNLLLENIQQDVDEAEYQGREVKLGKPMAGDVKKFKVYVRNPATGKTIKVNFGDPNMRIKKSNPARRRSFRARHNCKNPGPRTKARYWSCRKW
jgi:hypothetical protein